MCPFGRCSGDECGDDRGVVVVGGTANELLCGPLVAACDPLVAPRFVILSVGGEGVVSRLAVFSSEESEEEECDGEGGWSRGVGKEGVVSLHLTTSSGGCIHIGLYIHVCMYVCIL